MNQMEMRVTGFSGFDSFLSSILTPRRMAKRVAKKLLAGGWKSVNLESTNAIIKMPMGTFRIVDMKGNVEPFDGELANLVG